MEEKKKNNLKQNTISYYWKVKDPEKVNENNSLSDSLSSPVNSLSSPVILGGLEDIEKQKEIGLEEEYRLQFDGGSRGNPGPSGSGTVIYNNKNEIIWSNSSFYHHQTNNYAEYMGLIKGLEKAVEMGIKRLKVEGDSQLVIQQVQGNFKCKHPNILPLYQTARELKNRIQSIQFAHIYRHLNKVADALANCGMDKGFNKKQLEDRNKKERLVQLKKKRRSQKNKKTNVANANTNANVANANANANANAVQNNMNISIKPIEKENKMNNESKENKEKVIKKRRRRVIRKSKVEVPTPIPKIDESKKQINNN
jgi:ribonuclease HI